MAGTLQNLLKLGGVISEVNSDSFIYELKLNNENIQPLNKFYEDNFIESVLNQDKQIVSIDTLETLMEELVYLEFVTSELKKIGYYLTLSDLIKTNRFEVPAMFYIVELEYSSILGASNEKVEKYIAITALINSLESKAKFVSEEYHKVLYLVQDNSFLELPIENIEYEEYFSSDDIALISLYISNIDSYKEKKTLFLKELIDFLSVRPKSERLSELIFNFEEFFDRCNTSFEYYLSNFSFNKIQLELDTSVLEHSKNIRLIINESQSKLIAIPAAFVLSVSQMNYSEPTALKNLLTILATFLFSYIISIFIKNQRNALEIVKDNVGNYKVNYKRSKSNELEDEKDLGNLSALINSSFKKTEKELDQQKTRLNLLQICNWGISFILLISLLTVIYLSSNLKLAILVDGIRSLLFIIN